MSDNKKTTTNPVTIALEAQPKKEFEDIGQNSLPSVAAESYVAMPSRRSPSPPPSPRVTSVPNNNAIADFLRYLANKNGIQNDHDDDELSDFYEDNVPFLEELLKTIEYEDVNVEKLCADIELFPRLHLTFKDVAFAVKTKKETKQILHPISGDIPPGKMVAIMGPSGCGKTTLLDILSQKKTLPHTGEILINGHKPDKFFPRLTSYVPQSDFGSGLDKVYEAVKFVSEMKAEYTKSEIKQNLHKKHIAFLIDVLGLKSVKNSFVGDGQKRGISGGQKRRLTLLKGLVTGPGVSFLDEPTSGLSSTDSELCVRALKNIAALCGTSFITVIHQPKNSIFEMFDHLILLSEGRPVYNGPVKDACAHFSKLGYPALQFTNPADHFLDVITPNCAGSDLPLFVEEYQENMAPIIAQAVESVKVGVSLRDHVEKTAEKNSANSRFVVPRWKQYLILQRREFRLLSRDIDEIITILVNNLLMGLVTGLVYLNAYNPSVVGSTDITASYQFAYLFMIIVMSSLSALNSIPAMVNSRIIFQNERSEGLYDILPFMASKLITTLLVNAVLGTMILMLSSYWLAGFPASHFMYTYAIITLGFLATESIISFTASMSTSFAMANSIAGGVIGILSLFNGFTANSVSTPAAISWIQYISPIYYEYQALVVHIYGEKGANLFALNTQWGVWGIYNIVLCD
eukprot:Pgem_evm1s8201